MKCIFCADTGWVCENHRCRPGQLGRKIGVQLPLLHIGIPDRFIEHGSRDTCLAAAGLDLAGLTASVERWWALHTQERIRSVRGA